MLVFCWFSTTQTTLAERAHFFAGEFHKMLFKKNCKLVIHFLLYSKSSSDRKGLLEGFYTDRSLQLNLEADLAGSIPYCLEHGKSLHCHKF